MQIKNERTGQSCYVSSFEFLEYHSIFNDEVRPTSQAFLRHSTRNRVDVSTHIVKRQKYISMGE